MATHFTEDEQQQLISAFEALGTKPKMDNVDDLRTWMAGFVRHREEADIKPDTSRPSPQPPSVRQSTHYVHPPTIAVFHGDSDQKGVPFDTWKFEVLTLQKEGVHSGHVITTAAKKSLRGQAAEICQRLGVNASIEQILDKFEGIYGTVEDTEDLMTLFYSAQQRIDEKVATWGCRLEDLLFRADQHLSEDATNAVLLSKFNNGLLKPIKDRIRHLEGRIKNFDELRVAARKVEAELADPKTVDNVNLKSTDVKPKKCLVNMTKAIAGDPDEVNWPSLVCSLQSRVEVLERNKPLHKPNSMRPDYGNNSQYHHQPSSAHQPSSSHHKSYVKPQQRLTQHNHMPNRKYSNRIPTCFRCGQLGHLQIGCRALLSSDDASSGNDMESAAAGQL